MAANLITLRSGRCAVGYSEPPSDQCHQNAVSNARESAQCQPRRHPTSTVFAPVDKVLDKSWDQVVGAYPYHSMGNINFFTWSDSYELEHNYVVQFPDVLPLNRQCSEDRARTVCNLYTPGCVYVSERAPRYAVCDPNCPDFAPITEGKWYRVCAVQKQMTLGGSWGTSNDLAALCDRAARANGIVALWCMARGDVGEELALTFRAALIRRASPKQLVSSLHHLDILVKLAEESHRAEERSARVGIENLARVCQNLRRLSLPDSFTTECEVRVSDTDTPCA